MTITLVGMTRRLLKATGPTLADHLEAYGPLPPTDARVKDRPGGLIDEIEKSGLRGRGGGWFPTHVKFRAVVDSSAGRSRVSRTRRPVLIANGMEGEPASSKDAVLLAMSPHLVLDGMEAAAATIGATEAFLAIHRGSPVIDVVQRAIAERPSGKVTITLVTPPARYVASEESALSHWVGDGRALPVHPDRPFQRGAAGRPTLVQNVETLAHIGLIVRHGGEWFASVGDPAAPGTTLVSIGGAVATPGVIEVPTGTPVSELIARAGGETAPVLGVLTGGYGGSWMSAEAALNATWDPSSLQAGGGTIGASILWVVAGDVCPLQEMDAVVAWMAGESAGQCGPCMFGLPSLSEDLHAVAQAPADELALKRLDSRLGLVVGRGGCKHPDGVARFVATGMSAFADETALHAEGRCSSTSMAPRLLPVPAVRDHLADPNGRDFR